jgi:hypothetical protein
MLWAVGGGHGPDADGTAVSSPLARSPAGKSREDGSTLFRSETEGMKIFVTVTTAVRRSALESPDSCLGVGCASDR